MKKIIVLMILALNFAATYSQSVVDIETLKTTDLGNQKLQVFKDGDKEYYCVLIKTGNRFDKYVEVGLGNKDEAIKILSFLLDTDVKTGITIRLENPTNNTAKWSGVSGYTVFSQGGLLKGRIRKQNIKGFLCILRGE